MKLTGSQVLIQTLQKEGVDTIFGYPGGSVLDIYDELYRSDVNHILVRHEQAAAHAADGYARTSGKVGVCLVTSGPGATNTVTGIATAYADSIPMVILTGQVPTPFIGSDAFQEADIMGITRPCTKHNFLVRRIQDLSRTISDAFSIASSGRPGPVLVDLPKDVIQDTIDAEGAIYSRKTAETRKPELNRESLKEALSMIMAAKKPVILTGGGVILGNASQDLHRFVKTVNVPVASTLMGIGGFPGTDPLWLGMTGMHGTYYANMAISNCDLLITMGTRFSDRITGKISNFASKANLIQIDIDAASINKNVQVDIPIESDCKTALVHLNKLLDENGFTIPEEERRQWIGQIDRWKSQAPLSYCDSPSIKPQCVIEKLYELTEGTAIVTTEVGQNQMWAAQYYHFDHPHTFLTPGGLGTMGYGFPAAIGAQIAFPDKTVVDIAGDGSIQMNIQELATAVNYKLPVKIVILNNGYLGMVRQWQEFFYGKRYSHSFIRNTPDFVKLAEAYGALGLRATKSEEIEPTLKEGLASPLPTVMDFHVEQEENVFPMVKPGAPLIETITTRDEL